VFARVFNFWLEVISEICIKSKTCLQLHNQRLVIQWKPFSIRLRMSWLLPIDTRFLSLLAQSGGNHRLRKQINDPNALFCKGPLMILLYIIIKW
jgi:hypothetical protein